MIFRQSIYSSATQWNINVIFFFSHWQPSEFHWMKGNIFRAALWKGKRSKTKGPVATCIMHKLQIKGEKNSIFPRPQQSLCQSQDYQGHRKFIYMQQETCRCRKKVSCCTASRSTRASCNFWTNPLSHLRNLMSKTTIYIIIVKSKVVLVLAMKT
jgi:hypothetical protein